MPPTARIIFVLLSLACLAFVLTRLGPSDDTTASPAPHPDTARSPAPASSANDPLPPLASPLATTAPAPPAAPAPAATTETPATRETILATLETAYTSYRPESLPAIAPYLQHRDREIRSAAREAVVQLGAPEGATLLRQSSLRLQDPREAAEFLDAADFLELPPAPPARELLPAKTLPGAKGVASSALPAVHPH
jgi:hypothetical protein